MGKRWNVYKNGKYIGITERDYEYAKRYWDFRSRQTGDSYTLVEVE